MTTDLELRIANAKSIVSSVLKGDTTPERDPARFEEDVVYMSVRITELHAAEWLLDEIASTGSLGEGLTHVIECMGPLREEAEARRAPGGPTSSGP